MSIHNVPTEWSFGRVRKEVYEVDSQGLLLGKVVIIEGKDYGGRTFLDVPPLSYFQDLKSAELKQKCEDAIVFGFTASNGHFYRTNRDDQTNMIGQKDEIATDETITQVAWKTEDVGYLMHTREEWLTIYQEAFNHKKTQLFKYDSLKKQVYTCTTKEEVDAIVW